MARTVFFVAILDVALILQQSEEQTPGTRQLCARKPRAIGRALQRYQEDNKKLTDHLKDLVPKYLTDKSALSCSSDEGKQSARFGGTADEGGASYLYEVSGDPDGGVSFQRGPEPDAKRPAWRDAKMAQRKAW
jgi:hypothetical protein